MLTVNMAAVGHETANKSNPIVLKTSPTGKPFAKFENRFGSKIFAVPKLVLLETPRELYRLRCGFEVTKPYYDICP